MDTLLSRDGTRIAFETVGHGRPLIAVVGAFNDRATAQPLADTLAPLFSVTTYDRRGRGDSTDTAPYAVEREIEDLAALIAHVGGAVDVFGFSSGAVLALHAAASGLPVTRLALYEPPPFGVPTPHADHLAELVRHGRRDQAVEYFQRDIVHIPEAFIGQARQSSFWPALEAMAHTLEYELRILDAPLEPAGISTPTLVISGADSMNGLHAAAQRLVADLPRARLQEVSGLHHNLVPEALGPLLVEFFGG